MWVACLGLLLLAWFRILRRRGRADSPSEPPKPPDSPAEPPPGGPATPRKVYPRRAAMALGWAYVIFAAWTFVAWYRQRKPLAQYKWGGDGWLGQTTYAGGADKFGHAWATMSLARLGTYMLREWGGYDPTKASLVSTTMSELLFVGVEVKDGFYWEFSFSDLTGDSVGAVLALLLDNFPRLDELFDFRV